jgi:hypothetical protein
MMSERTLPFNVALEGFALSIQVCIHKLQRGIEQGCYLPIEGMGM